MANEEQVRILKRGVKVWNKWRLAHQDIKVDLSDIHLRETNLNGIILREANLQNADIRGCSLFNAELVCASLKKAILQGVNLKLADLTSADLTDSDLTNANLNGAILNYTKLTGTHLAFTSFEDTDMRQVIDLQRVKHFGQSFLGVSTFHRSSGRIPEAFLRGCGLSDIDIEYSKLANPGLDPEQVTDITYKIHQLYFGGGIQYYSCFISYNSRDEGFAKLLHNDLQNNGVRCWFAPEDMKIGDQIRPTIDRQIRLRDKLLVVLSKNSIKSEWVGDEVEGALQEENNSNRLVLFPIRLDDAVMNICDDWAANIKRRRHIGNFSNWKDKASYQKALERLLRDLKAAEGDVHGE